jgi:AI-2E family transporter
VASTVEAQSTAGGSVKFSSSTLNNLLILVIVVAILFLAREVLMPIALAGILSFMLAPPVRMLQNLRFPRALAVVLVVLLAFAAIFALGGVMTQDAPQCRPSMGQKLCESAGFLTLWPTKKAHR